LFDYLAAEVFDDMPADLRDFLVRCSVLPELTAARCGQVSGVPQAARLLEEVERRGLFVSTIDAQELTLRLHDLMREFLEDRLRRNHADEIPLLLRRAAQGEPDLARAVGYLARAGAWDEAAQALAQRGPALLAVGEGTALERMLALFPPAEFKPRPDLQLLRGLAAFLYYDWDTLLVAMQHATQGFALAGRSGEAALARAYACTGLHHTGHRAQATQALAELRQATLDHRVRAVVSYVSAWDAFSNECSDEVATHVAQMLDALDQVPDPRLWHQCANLSLFIGLPGMTPLLLRFAEGVMRVAGDVPSPLRAGVMHVRTCLALAAGRIEEAWHWLQLADDECHWLGMPRLLLTDNGFSHVLLHALRGEREAAHAHAALGQDDMTRRGALSHRRVHETDLLMAHSRASWVLNDEPALRAIDAALQRAANPFEWSTARRCRALSRSFIALLDGELDAARELLEPLVDKVERHMFFPATQARIMLADVQQRLGQIDTAAATLRPWLVDASGSGEIGGALLAGAAMLGRLAALDWGERLARTERALLERLHRLSLDAVARASPVAVVRHGTGATESAAVAGAGVPGDDLANLTEREREVLQRMASGDSNKVIARAFDLSPHTVKRHVANILGKLGVATRGQAAARWREQGLR
jgi:LuxR family maltose regulon positive regulatory protein